MPSTPSPRRDRRARAQALAGEIYTEQRRRLLAIGIRNCPSYEDAEEALQDAFALFIDHFDPDSKAPPVAWLTLTLKRRCWACYRRKRLIERTRTPSLDSPAAENETPQPHLDEQRLPEDIAEIADEISNIRHALSHLKPDERRALSLLALGYSYAEICNHTGWSYTKVNRCLTEGRAKLRKAARQTTRAPRARGAKTSR